MTDIPKLVEHIPEHTRADVEKLAKSVLFMRGKLADAEKGMANEQIVIPYDNGGGQVGIRANPAFSEYEKLLKCYMSTLAELREILEKYKVAPAPPKVTAVAGNSKWKQRASNG